MRQALRPGALGRPGGSGWRGRWEGGSGWGTHVNSKKITTTKKKNPEKGEDRKFLFHVIGSDENVGKMLPTRSTETHLLLQL